MLVIDDEPVMQELICSHLQARHFLVQSADEGRRGVDAALKLRPDVVICDLKLPDIHGFKVIELLLQ